MIAKRTGMRWMMAAAVVALTGFTAGPANAGLEENFDELSDSDLGTLLRGPETRDFEEPQSPEGEGRDIGDLTNRVWFNESRDVYTYAHEMKPGDTDSGDDVDLDDVTQSSTRFNVLGLLDAGWSYDEANSVGMATDDLAFNVVQVPNGDIRWRTEDDASTDVNEEFEWDSGEVITLFFTSDVGPGGGLSRYGISNNSEGAGLSFAPAGIPTPAALPGGLLLLGIFGLRGRRHRRVA